MPRVALEAGAKLVIINQGETPYDAQAHLRFSESIREVLPAAVEKLKELMETRVVLIQSLHLNRQGA